MEKEEENTLILIEEDVLSNKDAYDYNVCFMWLFDNYWVFEDETKLRKLSSWTRNNNRVVRTQIRTYSYNEKGLYLDNNNL